jgi:ubiquitin carboxyl-terminal hydrolase 5/13
MWFYQNMENPDISKPLVAKKAAADGGSSVPQASVDMIVAMGLTEKQARRGLRKCDNDVERAMDFIFSHMDEPDSEDDQMQVDQTAEEAKSEFENKAPDAGVYALHGFVTHLGSGVHSGHYVAHIKKDGKWIYYNDAKVAETTEPPIGKGYMYFLRKP